MTPERVSVPWPLTVADGIVYLAVNFFGMADDARVIAVRASDRSSLWLWATLTAQVLRPAYQVDGEAGPVVLVTSPSPASDQHRKDHLDQAR